MSESDRGESKRGSLESELEQDLEEKCFEGGGFFRSCRMEGIPTQIHP